MQLPKQKSLNLTQPLKPFLTKYGTERTETGISEWGEALTKQSPKEECDVNYIVAKYKETGLLPPSQREPRFGDFSNVRDYQSSLNAVIAAQEAFDELPAIVRKRFSNEPAELLAFLEDPRNKDEAIKLGLVEAPTSSQPSRSEAAAPAPALTASQPQNEVKKT